MKKSDFTKIIIQVGTELGVEIRDLDIRFFYLDEEAQQRIYGIDAYFTIRYGEVEMDGNFLYSTLFGELSREDVQEEAHRAIQDTLANAIGDKEEYVPVTYIDLEPEHFDAIPGFPDGWLYDEQQAFGSAEDMADWLSQYKQTFSVFALLNLLKNIDTEAVYLLRSQEAPND